MPHVEQWKALPNACDPYMVPTHAKAPNWVHDPYMIPTHGKALN